MFIILSNYLGCPPMKSTQIVHQSFIRDPPLKSVL